MSYLLRSPMRWVKKLQPGSGWRSHLFKQKVQLWFIWENDKENKGEMGAGGYIRWICNFLWEAQISVLPFHSLGLKCPGQEMSKQWQSQSWTLNHRKCIFPILEVQQQITFKASSIPSPLPQTTHYLLPTVRSPFPANMLNGYISIRHGCYSHYL